jgi:hypothetical protein
MRASFCNYAGLKWSDVHSSSSLRKMLGKGRHDNVNDSRIIITAYRSRCY